MPTYPVRGIVRFTDGEPVRTGVVELMSLTENLSATGRIREDGSFVLGTYESADGAAAGKHRAIVVQMIVNDGSIQHEKDHGRAVDARFASYETSGLLVDVKAVEQNDISITLEFPATE